MTTACLVTQRLGVYSPDGLDADELPDWVPISGKVKFMPNILTGDSFLITDADGKRTSAPKSYTADIIDGVLSDNGTEGVRLFAAGPNSNPEKLSYTARYLNLTANGDPVVLRDVMFEVSPGGHVDLTDATPVAGTPALGITRGEPGPAPYIGENGNWWVDGKDLEVPVTGPEGYPGIAPYIKDGNWWVGSQDLGVSASGPQGEKGDPGPTGTLDLIDESIQTTIDTVAIPAIEGARDDAIGQVAGAVAAEVAAVKFVHPPLTGSENIDTLPTRLYPVPTVAVATALGLPLAQPGELLVTWLDTAGVRRRQTFYADPTTGADAGLHIYRRWCYNGTWQPWTTALKPSTPFFRGPVPAGVHPDTMTGRAWEGEWSYPSGKAAEWGVPSNAAGFINISSSGASTLQALRTLTTPIQNHQRRWYNGVWSGPWEVIGGGTAPVPVEPVEADEYAAATSKNALNMLVPSTVDPTLTYEADHAALVADLKTRLGPVSTGGKAAIALVADHGTTAFKDWVWDALKARNIPFTMALAPEVHLDGKGDVRHTATNDDIKQWISEGLAIASHSGDHDGATGYFDVSRQIVTSKKKLEEKLETTVDCWVQPGYVLANGSYDGFGTGQSASRYTDYYAGRLLQQTYPVITGYAGDSFVYPGDADLPVGVRRSLVERKDAYQGVLDYIQQAIDTGGKHVSFIHPYALVESSSTYVTRTEYLAFLDWLVQKRDAGDLVLLTLPELAISR